MTRIRGCGALMRRILTIARQEQKKATQPCKKSWPTARSALRVASRRANPSPREPHGRAAVARGALSRLTWAVALIRHGVDNRRHDQQAFRVHPYSPLALAPA